MTNEGRRLAGLILLRALIVSVLFGAALLANLSVNNEEVFARSSLFGYLSTAYVTAALEFVWVLSGKNLHRLAFLHSGIEAALAAWLVALTGGIESPFIFLLLIATVLGSVAAGSVGAFVSATLATFALWGLAAGLPIPGLVQPTHAMDSRTLAVVLVSAGGCYATAALASYLTERLRHTGQELVERETQLREFGARYLTVAQSLRSGLMTLDVARTPGDAIVTLLNDPGAAILGLQASAVQGRSLREWVPALSQALDVIASGDGRSEVPFRQSDRSVLLGFSVAPLKSETGELLGSVVTFQDLTEQRKLEEALRRQTHLASLGELAAGLAHEVRNPLAALSGAAQMLGNESSPSSPSDDVKLFAVIQRETAHLEALVSDFLTFARPPVPVMANGDLADLATTTFEAFRASEQVGSRRLECRVASASARFDAGQVRQVVWNLLRNALEATQPEGRIALEVRSAEGQVELSVSDDGRGIPPKLRERIFEPFFTTKERGTGLGLALVGRIVGSHRGTLDVESSTSGTTFTVRLPAV